MSNGSTLASESLAVASSSPSSSANAFASTSSEPMTEGNDAEAKARRRKAMLKRREKHRIIAACSGAIVTTLTMTPFDVIKTRLQTQHTSESMFVPSSNVPPPTTSLPSTPVSRNKGKARALAPSPMQHARSLAATNLATCCQKTYFTTNLAENGEILCRFDPRDGAATGGFKGVQSSASRIINFAMPSSIAGNSAGGGSALLLNAGEACLYPSPAIAAQQLPSLSAPSSRHFAGFFDAANKIIAHEGVSTLWRGLSASLVMSVPSQVIYMVGYDTLRSYALENVPRRFTIPSTDGSHRPPTPSGTYIATTTFLAGSTSRTCVAALLSPLELFRTRLQSTSGSVTLGNVSSSILHLVKTEGTFTLWRGLSAQLWRDVPFSGAYWAGYEAIRRLLTGGKGMGEVAHGEKAGKTFGIAFASGAGSGTIASFLTHPFDVIKTRRQTENSAKVGTSRGTYKLLQEVAKQEGMAGLWRGMVPRVAKVAPACGIMIGAYEIGLRWTGEIDEK